MSDSATTSYVEGIFSNILFCIELPFDWNLQLDCMQTRQKTVALGEILRFLQTRHSQPSVPIHPIENASDCYRLLSQLIVKNLIRSLPPPHNPVGREYDTLENEHISSFGWFHREMVYKIFFRLLESPRFDVTLATEFFTASLGCQLIWLFAVEDSREREHLTNALHRYYRQFPAHRKELRQAMYAFLGNFIQHSSSTQSSVASHYGVSEILSVLSAIVNGYSVPLRKEHSTFFMRTLLPLHRSYLLATFAPSLCQCMLRLVGKDLQFGASALSYLLRNWPKSSSQRELLYLEEIEQILLLLPGDQFYPIANGLWRLLINRITESFHFQVIERALGIMRSDPVLRNLQSDPFISQRYAVVVPVLEKISASHWCSTVQVAACSVLRILVSLEGVETEPIQPLQIEETHRIRKKSTILFAT